jgi:hypothetical protein
VGCISGPWGCCGVSRAPHVFLSCVESYPGVLHGVSRLDTPGMEYPGQPHRRQRQALKARSPETPTLRRHGVSRTPAHTWTRVTRFIYRGCRCHPVTVTFGDGITSFHHIYPDRRVLPSGACLWREVLQSSCLGMCSGAWVSQECHDWRGCGGSCSREPIHH